MRNRTEQVKRLGSPLALEGCSAKECLLKAAAISLQI
jgi:hypothetical protein